MKFVLEEDKIIIYLNKKNCKINLSNKESFEKYIKDLVISIKKIYGYKISGSYNVNIYENKNLGLIIEFIKKESIDFFPDLIDLKLNIFYDSEVFIKLDDYFLIKKYKNVYYDKNSFYINIDELIKKDLLILSEFGKFIYGKDLENIKDKILVLSN